MKSYLQNLWDDFETLLAEVVVEAENFIDSQSPHGLKTTAVHKRKSTAVGCENIVHNIDVLLFGHPIQLQ